MACVSPIKRDECKGLDLFSLTYIGAVKSQDCLVQRFGADPVNFLFGSRFNSWKIANVTIDLPTNESPLFGEKLVHMILFFINCYKRAVASFRFLK